MVCCVAWAWAEAIEGAGRGENATIHAPRVVEGVARCNLQLVLLGRAGRRGCVVGRDLGGAGAVGRRSVQGRRVSGRDTVGAKTEEKAVDISWIGYREGAGCAVV